MARYLLEQKELERQLKRYADQAQEWQDKAQLRITSYNVCYTKLLRTKP